MTSRELQNDPRRLQNGVPKSSRIPLRHPVAPRGAAQTRYCKPPEREHQFHRPARSTWDTSCHAAPPVVRLVLSPPSLTFSHLLPTTSLPPRRTQGVGGLTGLRPLPPTPKREALRITIERGLRRFSTLTLRRTLKPRSFMSATPQTSYKTILRPENASADLRQGASFFFPSHTGSEYASTI